MRQARLSRRYRRNYDHKSQFARKVLTRVHSRNTELHDGGSNDDKDKVRQSDVESRRKIGQRPTLSVSSKGVFRIGPVENGVPNLVQFPNIFVIRSWNLHGQLVKLTSLVKKVGWSREQ